MKPSARLRGSDLVRNQSGRCLAAYAYASAGPGESTSDLVFGGHCLIAENGLVLESGAVVMEMIRLLNRRPRSPAMLIYDGWN